MALNGQTNRAQQRASIIRNIADLIRKSVAAVGIKFLCLLKTALGHSMWLDQVIIGAYEENIAIIRILG